MKKTSTFLKGVFGVALLAGAAMPAAADVTVSYSPTLEKYLESVDRVERQREKIFRKFNVDRGGSIVGRSSDILAKNRYKGTEWGNERAIPNIEDFSVTNLLEAMLERGVKAANPDFDGSVQVHIDRLNVSNHSVSILRAPNTYMEGTVKLLNADGTVVAEEKIKAIPTRKYTVDRSYDGEDYAYVQSTITTRVGPVFADFTEEALEKLFPEYDAPGFILLRNS